MSFLNLISDIFKENLIQTPIQLKQQYKGNETSENLKTEAEIQVLLVLEEYINTNIISHKLPIDEDFVWEVANSFLFGEIYPSFFSIAPELILSLMEELGYDKEENLDESCNSSNPASASNSLVVTPNKSPSLLLKNDNNYSQFSESFSKEESDNTASAGVSKLNALFEDFCSKNEFEANESDELIPSQKNEEKDNDSDDLLNDFKKKKQINRFSSFSGSSTTGRSIVIQSKKRMRLKIRSPCKDSSSSVMSKATGENLKKSPGTKTQNILTDDDNGKKRPRTYLITDTPDHKQKTTIIRTKQEKIRKRFSFQPLSTNSNLNNNSLPVIPDTPVKDDNRFINNSEPMPPIGIISSREIKISQTCIDMENKTYLENGSLFLNFLRKYDLNKLFKIQIVLNYLIAKRY
ncbi:hypothetical protein BpHYR1_043718 [Brachionus plicatilis]|uniref:Uncharacterized protein n=1 Tax=Brachionus plicatilis TaxID=10195 RepID=A0A3M7PPD3_BRAPC|nr:hypothetical protein BpHYR1_043718 [Brachionus plicatilis]